MKEWSRECHFYYPPNANYVVSPLIFMVKGFWEYFHGKESLRFFKDFQEWKFKGLHDEYSQGPLINWQETSETFEKLFLITFLKIVKGPLKTFLKTIS
jgi:hypothetical protein